ncbi:MAG TPA: hypothetical protein VFQ14_04840 [Thermoleophilaceae bacterium]|nr:hypothetical protein [Thermoleophilaceae bacterium]
MADPAKLASLFAVGRLAFGAGLMAVPDKVAGGWIGEDARRPAVKIAVRGLGARDIALSAGALATRDDPARLAGWVAAAIGCDLADMAITLATPADALPANARWGTVALAGGSALAGALLYCALDR